MLLKFVSQTVMEEPSSSKRCHVVTGSTPHKPVEKRSREGNSHARKPLDFSVKNLSASVDSLTSPSYKVFFCCYITVVCPFLFVFFSVFGWQFDVIVKKNFILKQLNSLQIPAS